MSGGDALRAGWIASQRRQLIGGRMRRSLGVQCSDAQLWCELLPFTALVKQQQQQQQQGQAAVPYSGGLDQQAVPRLIAPANVPRYQTLLPPAQRFSAAQELEEDEIVSSDVEGNH